MTVASHRNTSTGLEIREQSCPRGGGRRGGLVENPVCLGVFGGHRDADAGLVTLKIELLILYLILYGTFRRVLDQVNSAEVP